MHEGGVHTAAVCLGLVLAHCDAQDVSLVTLHGVHQGAIPSVPEACLAPAVPGDHGHVRSEGDAPDDRLLIPLGSPGGHPGGGVAGRGVPDPDGVCAAGGEVKPINMPGEAENSALLPVQHLHILRTLIGQGEQAHKPEEDTFNMWFHSIFTTHPSSVPTAMVVASLSIERHQAGPEVTGCLLASHWPSKSYSTT